MQVFTQDHNTGGQEGVWSSFQRKAIQERGLAYTQAIIQHSLEQIASRLPGEGQRLVIYNPHAQPWSGLLPVLGSVETPGVAAWHADIGVFDEHGKLVPSQVFPKTDGQSELVLDLPELPPVGYCAFKVARRKPNRAVTASPFQVSQDQAQISLSSPALEVAIDLTSGAIGQLMDKQRGENWGGPGLGELYSLTEKGNDVKLIVDADAAPAREAFLGAELIDTGPLAARVHLRKLILNSVVEQTLTLWASSPRLDLETRIFWSGKRNQQVRMRLTPLENTSGPKDQKQSLERANITHGSPFYGAGWNETMDGCGPWNSDEVSPELQMSYREVLGWLHLRGKNGGLAILSDHAWYHHEHGALDALLMRTVQSCGDARLYYEQAGEHVFRFTFIPGETDWRLMNVQQIAWRQQKPPVNCLAQTLPNGAYPIGNILPDPYSLLRVQDERFALSSLYPGARPGTVIARIWETQGRAGKTEFSGPLADGRALAVDFLEENGQPLDGHPGAWALEVPAWGICTVMFEGGRG